MTFELARKVADAVLFEGYLLYPYRASSRKNQVRWQFGVLVPRAWSEAGAGEPWASQTECLVEPRDGARIHVKVRCLQVQARGVEQAVERGYLPVAELTVDDKLLLAFDEGVEREVDASFDLADLLAGEQTLELMLPAGTEVEPVRSAAGDPAGRVVREHWAVSGLLRASAELLDGPYGVVRLRLRTENLTAWGEDSPGREQALRRSLVAAHTLVAVEGGSFVSLLEPPEWARPAAEACANQHTWPVLVGERSCQDTMLSSPIILYDWPEIAPESQGDLFDSTEIDEILTLRTMALTDDEKREARATDARAAEVIDRVDAMPQELLDRLHGAVRYLREPGGSALVGGTTLQAPQPGEDPELVPWWDPGADTTVSPTTDSVVVAGVALAKGSRVRLRPGQRRADAQDIFLTDREATVEAVFLDVDGNRHLAVTLADDPAADLQRWHGRYLYFSPDEVEPLGEAGG